MITWPFVELMLIEVMFHCSREGLSKFAYFMDARGFSTSRLDQAEGYATTVSVSEKARL
jgi:hypothetical protein